VKYEIEPIAECAFSPVVIKLTLESKEELQELWYRLSVHRRDLREVSLDTVGYTDFDFNGLPGQFSAVWFKIGDIMKQRGIGA